MAPTSTLKLFDALKPRIARMAIERPPRAHALMVIATACEVEC